ncbi:response regulator [Thiomicrorhabdus sp.]|uniref:hybrid sensor histidine kinase/response regulator n=1 Tax=Thiomicrorhabdus sp. TaxID=2039724 RepID=UPI0029C8B0D7|nr:response regulator [Thiomicrorhabdus sp.]
MLASYTVLYEKGVPIRCYGVNHDITEVKKKDREILNYNRQMQTAAEAASLGFWRFDIEKLTFTVDRSWLKMMKVETEENGGVYSWDRFLERFIPKAEHKQLETKLSEAFLYHHRYQDGFEHQMVDSDGSVRYFYNFYLVRYNDQGLPVEGLGVMQDITIRKRAEEEVLASRRQLSDAQKIAKLGSWYLDLESGELQWSDEIYRIFELDPDGFSPSYEAFLQKIHPDDRDLVNKTFKKSLENKTFYQVEHRLLMKDGGIKYVLERGNNLFDENGEPIASQGTVQDITETKHMERSLIEAKEKAEEANKAKGMFLANMSHEIRTPLNGVIGLTQLALGTPLSPVQKDYLLKSQKASKALLSIINDILDYSKAESGKLELENVEFEVNEILSNASDLFSYRAQEKNLHLFFHVDPDIPAFLIGDPLRISQIVNNLVGNAIKFTESGSVEVQVNLTEKRAENVTLEFVIKDSGIGITESQMRSLFQPFVQADNSNTRKFGGTGLGLVISRQLVETMGGHISVDSRFGEGSEFRFTITLDFDPDAVRDNHPELEPLRGKRFLVLDDNEIERRAMVQILEGWKLQVKECFDSEAAMQMLHAEHFDFLILDWKMPKIDGLELLKRLQNELELSIPHVLMVTAFGKEALLLESRKRQVTVERVLSKPFTSSSLLACLLKEQERDFMALGRVLLAEDNELNQVVALENLKRFGLEVEVVSNGLEAVKAVQDQEFDLILMDLQMPVMDGFEAALKIHRMNKNIPIVALSAAVMEEDKKRTQECGMVDHLAKPIDLLALQKVLSTYLKTIELSPGDTEFPVLSDDDSANNLFDLQSLTDRIGSRTKAYELLAEFAEKYRGWPLKAEKVEMENGLSPEWMDKLHTLTGVCGNLSLGKSFELVSRIYQSKDQAEQAVLWPQFLQVLADTIDEIDETVHIEIPPGELRAEWNDEQKKQLLDTFKEDLQSSHFIEDERIKEFGHLVRSVVDETLAKAFENAVRQFEYETALEVLQKVEEALDA